MKIKIPVDYKGFTLCHSQLVDCFNFNHQSKLILVVSSKSSPNSYLIKYRPDDYDDYKDNIFFLDTVKKESTYIVGSSQMYIKRNHPELIGKTFYVSIEDV